MEKKSNSIVKTALQYGAILAAASIVYSVFLHAIGQNTNQALGAISYLITLVIIGVSLKIQRDSHQGGYLTYGEGVKLGFLISLFAGIVVAGFAIFMVKQIDPSIEEEAVNKALEEALKQGGQESQLEMTEKMTRFMFKPVMLYAVTLILTVIIGVIESLILAAIFQKKKDPFSNAMEEVEK